METTINGGGAKERLEKERDKLRKQIKNLEVTPEFGSDVDSFEEEADEAEEFSANLGLAKTFRERVSDIERAIEKLESGTYGTCERCGMRIEGEILNIAPESKFCKKCKASIST